MKPIENRQNVVRIRPTIEFMAVEFELICFGHATSETSEAARKSLEPQVVAEMIRINGEHFNRLTLG